ncbi:MAG: hypothetical protein ACKOCO_11755, partial [Bacteroidota bacterium]
HPASYRTVVFKDISTDDAFLGKSCINSKETITWEDGKEYPLVMVSFELMQDFPRKASSVEMSLKTTVR